MTDTRRSFLQSTAAIAAGMGGAAALLAQAPRPASELQVPKMKFGKYQVSRLIAGCNPFYGFSHFNQILGTVMREYYTPERVRDVLHQCNRFGINTFNCYPGGRRPADFDAFLAEGGQMNVIAQGMGDPVEEIKAFKPMAIYRQGEVTDRAYQDDQMDTVKEWCKKVRGMGSMVGVGTHKPEVIALIEEQGWDVDFYAGCVYNRTRTADEWKKTLNGEIMEMPSDIYMQSDPARMYRTMRQTRKPCFAFKILAAGRIPDRGVAQAFRTAFESIKPIDGIYVGMFPRVKDEVRENAEIVHRILAAS
jgi:hypothetical protein